MSYILEALKKAQAERQLGNAPTIHAPQAAPLAQPGAAASRRPLFIGLSAGALVVAAGAVFLWRGGPVQAPAGQVTAVTAAAAGAPGTGAPAPASPSAASPAATASAAPAPTSPAPAAPVPAATLEVSAPPPPPRAEAPRVAEARPPAPAAHAPAHAPAVQPAAAPVPVPSPAPATAQAPAAPVRAPAPAPEDNLPFLQQLPDAVQRDIPRVAFGGYMYSANPADRLLLVDKNLRHEGEEVAPGLVLEKLLPRAAVMNYRGMRYRVGL